MSAFYSTFGRAERRLTQRKQTLALSCEAEQLVTAAVEAEDREQEAAEAAHDAVAADATNDAEPNRQQLKPIHAPGAAASNPNAQPGLHNPVKRKYIRVGEGTPAP